MKPAPFKYILARSLEEALSVKAESHIAHPQIHNHAVMHAAARTER